MSLPEDSTTTPALESVAFIYLRLYVIPFHIVLWHVYVIFIGHMYLYYVWAMGVFTTSWWVVNQPIVVVILIYAYLCHRLVVLPLLI